MRVGISRLLSTIRPHDPQNCALRGNSMPQYLQRSISGLPAKHMPSGVASLSIPYIYQNALKNSLLSPFIIFTIECNGSFYHELRYNQIVM